MLFFTLLFDLLDNLVSSTGLVILKRHSFKSFPENIVQATQLRLNLSFQLFFSLQRNLLWFDLIVLGSAAVSVIFESFLVMQCSLFESLAEVLLDDNVQSGGCNIIF